MHPVRSRSDCGSNRHGNGPEGVAGCQTTRVADTGPDEGVASPLSDLFTEQQLLDLETGRVRIGDVVGHDVELAA